MRWSALFLVLVCAQASAQEVNGKLDCKYTGTDFVYDCRITLERGGRHYPPPFLMNPGH